MKRILILSFLCAIGVLVLACASAGGGSAGGDGGAAAVGGGNCGTCQVETGSQNNCKTLGLPPNSCDCKTGQSISGSCPAKPATPGEFCCANAGP